MLTWLPFLFLDIALYPQKKILVILRLIVSSTGFIALMIYISGKLKKHQYHLLYLIIFIISILSGIILGIIKGDPVYMGGFSIVLLVTPFMPFKKVHALIIIICSLSAFILTGLINNISFAKLEYSYGMYNLISAVIISIIAIYYLDRDRKMSYGKNYLIQQTNEALESSNIEIINVNKKIKKTATKLNLANIKLTNLIELKSEILNIAAHDLKNPLQIILGYVEILNQENNQSPRSQEKLIKIEKSVEKMIEIILKLLESETIETGEYKIKKQNIIITDILKAIINENNVQTVKKQQKIFFTERNIHFLGDPFILKQIFVNLLSNAMKFSPSDSKIIVKIKEKKDRIIVSFKDEGPGLSESDQKNLFKKFKKLSAKPTANENSSGLGLSIVKRYVEIHNGRVYAENNKSKGATFFVELNCIDS